MPEPFQIGISDDFPPEAGDHLKTALNVLFDILPYVKYRPFAPTGVDDRGPVTRPEDIAGLDAVLVLSTRFTAASFAPGGRLATIARWGVGYDRIDIPACNEAGVLVGITVDAVRRPVAEAALTLMLALAKNLFEKDRTVRAGRWDLRAAAPAIGLRGKVVGSVGLGNIAGELFRLLEPFGLARKLAADPYAGSDQATALGVELVDLETLFRESDIVTVNCPLTAETRGLVDARLLNLMQPTAYFVNTSRGPIVVQDDLLQVLQAGRIAGAGLDVFDPEPLPEGHPLTQLDNVILAPHSLAWTDEMYRDNSLFACENILAVLRGEVPRHTVNHAVVQSPRFQAKLQTLRERWAAVSATTTSIRPPATHRQD